MKTDKPKTEAPQETPTADPANTNSELVEGELEKVSGGLNFTAPTPDVQVQAPLLNPGVKSGVVPGNHNQTLKRVRSR